MYVVEKGKPLAVPVQELRLQLGINPKTVKAVGLTITRPSSSGRTR